MILFCYDRKKQNQKNPQTSGKTIFLRLSHAISPGFLPAIPASISLLLFQKYVSGETFQLWSKVTPPALVTRALRDPESGTVSCLAQHTESSLQIGHKPPLSQAPSSPQPRTILIQKPEEASGDRLRTTLWNILGPGHVHLTQHQPGHLLPCTSLFPPHTQRGQTHWKLPLEILSVKTPVIGGQQVEIRQPNYYNAGGKLSKCKVLGYFIGD